MPMDTRDIPVAWDELEHGSTGNVGNPHIVFFVPEADAVALDELGPRIETDPLFPERVNVNVASLDGDNQLQLRVWERGVGLTQRSEEHTSELQSLMRISYAVFCLKKKHIEKKDHKAITIIIEYTSRNT